MRILPKVVQTLITSTPDATRVRDNLTTAVQPTLDFLNTFFRSTADGALQVQKNLRAIAGAAVNGDVSVIGNLNWSGNNITLRPQRGNGIVVVPGASADPPFYITNPQNTDALILASLAGYFYAVSFVSRQGFPCVIDCGTYWNTNAAANTMYGTVNCVFNAANNSLGATNFVYKFPRAGSIIGYSLNNAGPLTGGNYISYYKNGSQIVNFGVGSGANNATFWGTHTKGTYAFAAGDTLTTAVGNTAAGNYQASLQLTLEMTA